MELKLELFTRYEDPSRLVPFKPDHSSVGFLQTACIYGQNSLDSSQLVNQIDFILCIASCTHYWKIQLVGSVCRTVQNANDTIISHYIVVVVV